MSFEEMNTESDADPQSEEKHGRSSNRPFWAAVTGLGLVALIALLCLAAYAFLILPRSRAGREQAQVTVDAQQTQMASFVTGTAVAMVSFQQTQSAPTATSPATATFTPTAVVKVASSTPAAPAAATVTVDPMTATVAALLTQASGVTLTVVPTTTALPTTGLADELNLPLYFGLALLLLVVIFFARRLRAST
jgi:LPXTG-motif cell wall-anchored protein